MTDILPILNIIILTITTGVIIWYTWETRRLAKLTEKQIKINIKPIIVVSSISGGLRLKNIGKSPALNIMVENIIRMYRNEPYIFKFSYLTEIATNEDKGMAITPYYKDKPIIPSGDADKVILVLLDYGSLGQEENYELIIDYNDVEMGKWRSISLVDKSGIRFKEVKEIK